jgi:hypothetical protein
MQKGRDATTRRAATASWSTPRWRAKCTGCERLADRFRDGSAWDVDLASVDDRHHAVELRPRFAARRAHVVVDELTGDGPTARSDEPQQIFALSVDTQLLAGPVLRMSEVDRFTHAGIVAKLSKLVPLRRRGTHRWSFRLGRCCIGRLSSLDSSAILQGCPRPWTPFIRI